MAGRVVRPKGDQEGLAREADGALRAAVMGRAEINWDLKLHEVSA